jgi:hypothetical protein
LMQAALTWAGFGSSNLELAQVAWRTATTNVFAFAVLSLLVAILLFVPGF